MLKNYTPASDAVATVTNQAQRVLDAMASTCRCAGCDSKFSERNPAAGGGVLIQPEGVATYQLCEGCALRWHRKPKFRKRLQREAYRTIFGAGPDQVGGTA